MEIKLTLNSKIILEKVFTGAPRGYNPTEVDEFLDQILKDYQTVENNVLMFKDEIDSLTKKVEELTKTNRDLEIEYSKFKHRFEGIKETDDINSSNIELVKRINKLEKYCFQNGLNPNNIK